MKALTTVLTKILEVVCAVLFTALVVIVVWQVVARQLLDNPQAWTEEASRMTFVWLGLFAAALVFAERGHIAVDFVVRKFGVGAQKTVAIVVQLLIIFFALALLVWGGWTAGQGAGNQRLAALSFLTLGQMYMVMPITGVIITLFAIDNIINIANGSAPAFAASEEEELVEQLQTEGAVPRDEAAGHAAAGGSTAVGTSSRAATAVADGPTTGQGTESVAGPDTLHDRHPGAPDTPESPESPEKRG